MKYENRMIAKITYNSYDFHSAHLHDKLTPDDYVNSCLLALNHLSFTNTAEEIALMIVGVNIQPGVIQKTKNGYPVSVGISEEHLLNSVEYFRNRLITNAMKDPEEIRSGIGKLIGMLDGFLHLIQTSTHVPFYDNDRRVFTHDYSEG